MNKSIRIIGMAAMVMLLAVSCKKENQDGQRKVTLTAGIESNSGKHHFDPDQKKAFWDEGDKIMVNGNIMNLVQRDANNTWGTFTCNNWDGLLPGQTVLYAISPATEQKDYEGEEGKAWKSRVSIPLTQEFMDKEDFFKKPLPMGISDRPDDDDKDGVITLNFHNLANVYCLPVCNSNPSLDPITKVEMIKNDVNVTDSKGDIVPDDLDIVGDIWYPHYGSETANIEIIDGCSSHTITMNCKTEKYKNGVTVGNTTTTFYFTAYPVQLSEGITFNFYTGSEGNVLVASFVKEINSKIDYNRIYTLYKKLGTTTEPPVIYDLADYLISGK